MCFDSSCTRSAPSKNASRSSAFPTGCGLATGWAATVGALARGGETDSTCGAAGAAPDGAVAGLTVGGGGGTGVGLSADFTAAVGAGWVGSFGAGGSESAAKMPEPVVANRTQKNAQEARERIEVCLARNVSRAILQFSSRL